MTQGILEFPSFLLAGTAAELSSAGLSAGSVSGCFCEFWLGESQSPKDSANLEFLEIASVALLPRNDEF